MLVYSFLETQLKFKILSQDKDKMILVWNGASRVMELELFGCISGGPRNVLEPGQMYQLIKRFTLGKVNRFLLYLQSESSFRTHTKFIYYKKEEITPHILI